MEKYVCSFDGKVLLGFGRSSLLIVIEWFGLEWTLKIT